MNCPHAPYCQHRTWHAAGDTTCVTRGWVVGERLRDAFRPRRYDHTAPSPWAPPQQAPAEPQSNINTTELQLGETRTSTRYRPKTLGDLAPSFVWSVVFAGAIGGIAYGFQGTQQQVIGWASGSFALSFLITAGVVLFTKDGASVITMLEKLTRTDINEDGQIGDQAKPTIPIEHNRDKAGLMHRQLGGIPCPQEGELALANWFYLVCKRGGNGFSYRAAKRYHITPTEAGEVQEWFLDQHPPQATRARNNWIRPNDEGLETMWGVVERNIPGATLPPERV